MGHHFNIFLKKNIILKIFLKSHHIFINYMSSFYPVKLTDQYLYNLI